MPGPGSKELTHLLRAVAWGVILHRTEITENKWHVHFPGLSDEVAGCELETSEEYEDLGRTVFCRGAMPSGLEYLDEFPDVRTNWISTDSVRRLWHLETEEGFLKGAGERMQQLGVPLGHDFVALRSLLQVAELAGWSLYMWEPGT
jgi:hypothetical protein